MAKKFLTLLTFAVVTAVAVAQTQTTEPADSVKTIVDVINANQVTTITIEQPQQLNERIAGSETESEDATREGESGEAKSSQNTAGQRKLSGYRVQVYSDSRAQSARNNAYSKKRLIESSMPQYRCYVIYNAPYWRVRLGDFKSRSEADAVAAEVKRRFPAMSRDVRVVRDRVNAK